MVSHHLDCRIRPWDPFHVAGGTLAAPDADSHVHTAEVRTARRSGHRRRMPGDEGAGEVAPWGHRNLEVFAGGIAHLAASEGGTEDTCRLEGHRIHVAEDIHDREGACALGEESPLRRTFSADRVEGGSDGAGGDPWMGSELDLFLLERHLLENELKVAALPSQIHPILRLHPHFSSSHILQHTVHIP